MKIRPHHLSLAAFGGQVVACFIGWKYLPPYLLHNPGLQILIGTFLCRDLLRFFIRDEPAAPVKTETVDSSVSPGET
jgi:hypothetical protein